MFFLKNLNDRLERIEFGQSRKSEAFWLSVSVMTALVFLTIASKSSPLYPMNDWVDMHCFFTVGRGWREGMLPYRDLVEQKGPLLYAAYALASMISADSFAGVFALEAVTFSFFLFLCSKILRLYLERPIEIAVGLIMMTACIVVSRAFCHGGSLEETTMFIPTYSLYAVLRAQKEKYMLTPVQAMGQGLCAGICLMTKYTICGFYIGLALAVAVWYLYRKKGKALLAVIGGFLAGVLLVAGLTILYFAGHGALEDLWRGYFYNNIFVYTGAAESQSLAAAVWSAVHNTVSGAASRLWENKLFATLIVAGLGWMVLRARKEGIRLLTVLLSFACLAFTTFFTGWSCTYYVLILAPFAVFGAAALMLGTGILFDRLSVKAWMRFGAAGVLMLACMIQVYRKSDNTYLIRYDQEDMPQFRFAETIQGRENPTLLNYGFMDGGFYFASGARPADKHFCWLMADIPGMMESQRACVESGRTDFVVTQNQKLSDMAWIDSSLYALVDEASFRFEDDVPVYYLYQKK